MISTETDDTYFNYKDYAEVKQKFLRKFSYNYTYDSTFLENALRELNVIPAYGSSFRDLFTDLRKHLVQDDILGWDTHKGCKYINYVLNDRFIKSNSNIAHKKAFELFKQFEDKLREHKHRSNRICDLYYISDDIYYKMEKLYNFYEKFRELNSNNNLKPNCVSLSEFVFLFKDYIRFINANESDIIKNKLTNFIDVLKNHKWATPEVCSNKLSEITSQKLHFSVKKEESAPHNLSSSLQSVSISSSDSRSVIVGEGLHHTNALESLDTQSSRVEEPAAETFPPKVSLQSSETPDNSVTLHTTEKQQSREGRPSTAMIPPNKEQSALEAKFPQQEEYNRNALPFKGKYYPEVSHQGVLEFPNIENETLENKGYLRTVKDAVSGFMEGVDPVPVVGVSEEEDTDNESLLDSMEHIQDFCQVFKDLKRGIFQMIKLI
ncbi:hypothetical protein PVMG_05991 [Plasmodium vivax Mauritania I]|uniref:VIR protein n=1 Tax=Plasmodium vivax Mauritania I TaxID=1035515 RepID=A0A0J9T4C2_PLAVI|nr:hypothetical protein PVMG_05991 [Plasmodium vivax Mauritania I]